MQQTIKHIEELREKLTNAAAAAEQMNEKETRLGIGKTNFSQVEETAAKLVPFEELWNGAAEFSQEYAAWNTGPVFKLDAEEVEGKVQAKWRQMYKLSKKLIDLEAKPASDVADKIKTKLDSFRKHVPLLAAICNKGLRDRHWKQVVKIVGFTIKPDDTTSLEK